MERGVAVIGTATTVREAVQWEASGVDLIVAQGSEAGGHRGTFVGAHEQGMIGSMALIPQMVDTVKTPVIAAGGIMDGRGVVASLALGAVGVQMGSAFLPCVESGAHGKYKEAVVNSTDESTVITRALSGKPARGIRNPFITDMERYAEPIPPYPVENALTRDIRVKAAKQGLMDLMSMWVVQILGNLLSRA